MLRELKSSNSIIDDAGSMSASDFVERLPVLPKAQQKHVTIFEYRLHFISAPIAKYAQEMWNQRLG